MGLWRLVRNVTVVMSVMGTSAVMGVRVGSVGMRSVMMRMGRVVMGVSLEGGEKFVARLWASVTLRRRVLEMRRLVQVIGLRMMGSPVVDLRKTCSARAGNARIVISNARR
jgi:hypothetical protein